jgi:Holliday junction resolvase
MARIVARRLVKRLQRAGFAVMKNLPAAGSSALGRGYEGR